MRRACSFVSGQDFLPGHAASVDAPRPGFMLPDDGQSALFVLTWDCSFLGMNRHVYLGRPLAGEAHENQAQLQPPAQGLHVLDVGGHVAPLRQRDGHIDPVGYPLAVDGLIDQL